MNKMKINTNTWIQPDALPLATGLGINDKTEILSANDCTEPLDRENYVIIGVLNKLLHANHDLSHDDNRGPFSKKAKKTTTELHTLVMFRRMQKEQILLSNSLMKKNREIVLVFVEI